MDWPWSLPYPRLLAVGLALALVVTGAWAASTSAGAFDLYNRGWEGASELRGEATAVGASPFVATEVSDYDAATPNRTVAFVLSPDERYADAEAARLRQFVRSGGTLVVAEDFGSHSNALLRRVGASTRVDGRLVRDERHYYGSPNISVATNVSESNLTGGADQLVLNFGTVLEPNGTRVLATTSPLAYVDANRNWNLDADESMQRYPVVTAEEVGNGRVVVVSDPSLFVNAMSEFDGNRQFVRALMRGHETVVLDHSHAGRTPPLVGAILALQRNPLLLTATGVALVGIVLVASARLPAIRSRRRGDEASRVSRERLRRGLARRHPDWESERADRVIAEIINQDMKEREDD